MLQRGGVSVAITLRGAVNEYRLHRARLSGPLHPCPEGQQTGRSHWLSKLQNCGRLEREGCWREPWDGPIRVNVQIYERKPENRRYDIDNVLKGMLDSLNGVCFLDDKQVTAASVAIYSDPEPEVRVTVTRTT